MQWNFEDTQVLIADRRSVRVAGRLCWAGVQTLHKP